ncbi:hypothetical protein [Corallococcus sp. 4LFB]|uniref:hypothetical protein n=1 Tax=Corallococcus sp. 4LFB TaxID=3383249 RepID=UPI0039752DB9
MRLGFIAAISAASSSSCADFVDAGFVEAVLFVDATGAAVFAPGAGGAEALAPGVADAVGSGSVKYASDAGTSCAASSTGALEAGCASKGVVAGYSTLSATGATWGGTMPWPGYGGSASCGGVASSTGTSS